MNTPPSGPFRAFAPRLTRVSTPLRGRIIPWLALIIIAFVAVSAWWAAKPSSLPDRLSDAEFWSLERRLSEPGGHFQIPDNFTSNEPEIGRIFTMLRERGVQGGVYVGVGPEQNLTYIAALRPAMAFVIDIRRQAAMQHLMFKAMFELSKDRADFISLLFSKPRPAALDQTTPIQQIWKAYASVATDQVAAAANAARIDAHLAMRHGFTLTLDDSVQLASVMNAFVEFGPGISTQGGSGGRLQFMANGTTFADLTGWSLDAASQPQSFLSTEENFQFVKALHEKNLIVPVTGDFGGPRTIRAIGAYLRKRGGTLNAFYLSNVERYLFQDGKQNAFFDNVATLPASDVSVFIRPYAFRQPINAAAQPLCGVGGFLRAAAAGHVRTNDDALACAQ